MPETKLRTVTVVMVFKVGFHPSFSEAVKKAEEAIAEIKSAIPNIKSITVEIP